MLVQIGQKPLADFTQPLEMMKDCHRRIEHFLEVLQKIVERFGEGDLPEEGRRALEASLNYFVHAAPRHTADEEASLFPRLRQSDSSEARAMLAEVERLEHDHRVCEEGHATVNRLVRQWMASARIEERQRAVLQSNLAKLAEIYAAHIDLEERRVFEVASRTLRAGEIRQIGEEMKQRRSIDQSSMATQ
jgi:hemerythrin-like domain-containing protein